MKRVLSAVLAILMLLSLTACGGSGGSSDNAEATTASVTEEVTETTIRRPVLPESDFDGYEFRIISRGRNTGNTHWYIFDTLYIEEKAGDVVNEAVAMRNQLIEDTYNFKLGMVETKDHQVVARSSILAGSDDFDVYGENFISASALAAEGLMVDLFGVPYLGLEEEWWDQRAREQMSIGGRLYTTCSDFTLLDKHGTWVTFFTKSMIEKFNLDNPYELVRTGGWTLPVMIKMCKTVSFEVDGDGVLTEADSYGTVGESWNITALMLGADCPTCVKDNKDIPQLNLESERVIDAFEMASSIIGDKSISLFTDRIKGSYNDKWIDCFGGMMSDDRALFYITGMNRVILLRGIDMEFGIIPNPKYDEHQEGYSCVCSHNNTNAISIPITNIELERTGIILEALTFESSQTTLPAYIEISVKTKYSRDSESADMLDLILDSRCFDLGIVFNWGIDSMFTRVMTSGREGFVSTVASNAESYKAVIKKTMDQFTNLG
ncbi:MAG: hypothetical protein GX628_02495 [Clostridiales bacterium]|nr:hypothetical protein [Clostridiales bacterium]